MDFDTMVGRILKVLPNATFDEDNDGQVIIYTDMRLDKNNNLVGFGSDTAMTNRYPITERI